VIDGTYYPRDMIGYGGETPRNPWPHGSKVAVQFTINYEEGAENCVLHGDSCSETYLSDITDARAYPTRHKSMESLYEYGSRAGFWRLHKLLSEYNIPVTVYGSAMALARNPQAVEAMQKVGWEISCHGLRAVDHQFMDFDKEKEQIAQAIELHTEITGERPLGWYTGRDSPNTRDILVESGGFLYDSDSYADDLPYWIHDYGQPYLIIPSALDTNDMRFVTQQGFNCGSNFFSYLKDAFDVLYREGETSPKMLTISLHCRIIGRPARMEPLRRFIQYVMKHESVWFCRREDIAWYWYRNFYPLKQQEKSIA